jgi:hypothetical protein
MSTNEMPAESASEIAAQIRKKQNQTDSIFGPVINTQNHYAKKTYATVNDELAQKPTSTYHPIKSSLKSSDGGDSSLPPPPASS